MFKRFAVVSAIAAMASSPLMAESLTYKIDPSHTFARFSYNHMGLSDQVNRFNQSSGEVVLDLDAKTGQVDIEIDTTSVDTGHEGFNGHIQGEDFLNTAQFPTATFKSTKVIFENDKPTKVEGELTIKGVSKPVTMDIISFAAMPHPMLKKPAIGADAEIKIKRSEFNAGKFAPAVSDEVVIGISLEAIAN